LTVRAQEYGFSPQIMVVEVNQPVQITFSNQGKLEHDFTIETIALKNVVATVPANHATHFDVDLHVAANPGQSSTITFTPTQPGVYEFYCELPGHKASGMTGTLIVKEVGSPANNN